jgi:anti-sigma regulatory factor (Ser/Thr protein kinase)
MRVLSRLFESRAISLEADPQRLGEAREWARDVAQQAGLDEPDCFQVRLAMSEAVANAIQHGSRDSRDRIEIEAFQRDGLLVFEVTDTGTFVAPTRRSTHEDESGRGLDVLSMIMDDVEMTSRNGGSVLRFAKKLS